jgi:hypothetical protein
VEAPEFWRKHLASLRNVFGVATLGERHTIQKE